MARAIRVALDAATISVGAGRPIDSKSYDRAPYLGFVKAIGASRLA